MSRRRSLPTARKCRFSQSLEECAQIFPAALSCGSCAPDPCKQQAASPPGAQFCSPQIPPSSCRPSVPSPCKDQSASSPLLATVYCLKYGNGTSTLAPCSPCKPKPKPKCKCCSCKPKPEKPLMSDNFAQTNISMSTGDPVDKATQYPEDRVEVNIKESEVQEYEVIGPTGEKEIVVKKSESITKFVNEGDDINELTRRASLTKFNKDGSEKTNNLKDQDYTVTKSESITRFTDDGMYKKPASRRESLTKFEKQGNDIVKSVTTSKQLSKKDLEAFQQGSNPRASQISERSQILSTLNSPRLGAPRGSSTSGAAKKPSRKNEKNYEDSPDRFEAGITGHVSKRTRTKKSNSSVSPKSLGRSVNIKDPLKAKSVSDSSDDDERQETFISLTRSDEEVRKRESRKSVKSPKTQEEIDSRRSRHHETTVEVVPTMIGSEKPRYEQVANVTQKVERRPWSDESDESLSMSKLSDREHSKTSLKKKKKNYSHKEMNQVTDDEGILKNVHTVISDSDSESERVHPKEKETRKYPTEDFKKCEKKCCNCCRRSQCGYPCGCLCTCAFPSFFRHSCNPCMPFPVGPCCPRNPRKPR